MGFFERHAVLAWTVIDRGSAKNLIEAIQIMKLWRRGVIRKLL
jgi:hypothetical protein